MFDHLRLAWAFIVEEVAHDSPVGVTRKDTLTRNTDKEMAFYKDYLDNVKHSVCKLEKNTVVTLVELCKNL